MKTPEKIANLIPLIFQEEHQWKYQLLSNWKNIFGSMSNKVFLERINKDVLVIAVNDACLMQELYTLSPLLLTSINQVLDKPYIQHLRFKRAGIRPQKKSLPRNHIPLVPHSAIVLTSREVKVLSVIKDPQLAQALKDFLIRCHRERETYKDTDKNFNK
jgi:hypothetical protein